MAAKKKQTTKSSTATKQSAKASTVTKSSSRVAKKPASRPIEATRRQPPRKAAQAARQRQTPAGDAGEVDDLGSGAVEEPEPETSPPREIASRCTTRKRKAPEDDDDDGDEPVTRRTASKKAKPYKGKGKAAASQGRATRSTQQLSDDEDAQESESDPQPSSKQRTRRKKADTPVANDSEDPQDRPADDADTDVDAVEREEDPWTQVDAPLATTEARVAWLFEGDPAELVASLKVFTDPFGFQSRLGYLVRLTLARTDDAGEQSNDVLGYIQAWRVSKPTNTVPHVPPVWQQEILSNGRKAPEIEETVLCLQALFTQAGNLQAPLIAKANRIASNPLMFIQMIYIRQRFQRRGLLGPALECFYMAIAQLPEWFAFAGNLVLVPSVPADYKGQAWDDVDITAAEASLIGVYTSRGYAVWVRDAHVRRTVVTVMGRAIP